ncbi:hypothetical protein VT50_0238015, partial [Streptomyces antioxidans]
MSSFGISGTNAHLIIEEATEEPAAPPAERDEGPVPWLVSARTAAGLRAQAARLADFAVAHPSSTVDIGFSLATTRAHLPHRGVVVGVERADLVRGLGALAAGRVGAGAVAGSVAGDRLAVVFTGQGAQRVGMG